MDDDHFMMRFDAQSLESFYRLAMILRRRGGSPILRRRRIAWPAGGAQATGLRDYTPGDDFRYIDWKVCARRDEILSKVFEGQEDRPIYVLVDCSASMASGEAAKLTAARHIAAMLGCVAITAEERIGGMTFAGRITAELPPIFGKACLPRWLRFVERIEVDDTPTDLARVADRLVRHDRRPGPTIVISDLLDPAGFQPGLDLLRRGGYDPRVVHLFDPLDAEPHLLGDVELFDVERGEIWPVTVTERAMREYRVLFARFLESVRNDCARHGTLCTQLSTALPIEQQHREILGLGASVKGRSS